MGVADLPQPNSLPRRNQLAGQRRFSIGSLTRSLVLIILLSVAVGVLAYQVPPSGRVPVGWLGDRLFLATSPGLGADPALLGRFFADELTPDAPTGRSRWTRSQAQLHLPNLGAGADLRLQLTAQGWPDDVLAASVAQPTVTVIVDRQVIGSFTPAANWGNYSFDIPADLRRAGDLRIDLEMSHVFTDTLTFRGDPRPKGIRLAELSVQTASANPAALYPPAWSAIGLLTINSLLLFLLLSRLLQPAAAVYSLTAIGVGLAGVGLATVRIWMGAALSVASLVLIVALIVAYQQQLLGLVRALLRRYASGSALGYGLVAVALGMFGYLTAQSVDWIANPGRELFVLIFPDSLLYGLLGIGLGALTIVLGRSGLPRLSDGIVRAIGGARGSLILLITFLLIWLGYAASVIITLPYVGHADYSDNAVVARNIAAGRGWVVDYVTQFFRLYDGLTRPQETWPLLQPLWMAPFMALFGPSAWAAKIPNLIFNAILAVLIYRIGTRIWDRRVGLAAAIFTLTNYLFFRLTIYSTNDLGFTVLSMGAIYALYQGSRATEQVGHGIRSYLFNTRWYLLSGVLTGLMMLQKPSGAMIAVGMGLWFLAMQHAKSPRHTPWRSYLWHMLTRIMRSVLPWAVVALVVLSPYLVRNLILFGKPVFSTESYDAWVLGYRGTSGDAWADIYRPFAPELGGAGLPDRSWILRWGFDATWTKFTTQVTALRDYLMPAWGGVADSGLGVFFSSDRCSNFDDCTNIASHLGAWLSMLAIIGALRFRRRLIGLLFSAFGPYIVFMLTYWRTDEERYWVILVPWLALFAAWAIWAGYDRLAAIGDRRWAPLGLILALAAIVTIVNYSRPDIADKVRNEPQIWAPDLAAYAWLDANIPPDAHVMTRIPWQLNWHTERAALMIPNTGDREQLLELARYYGIEYLVLENQLRVKGDVGRLLAPLMDHDNQVGDVIDGFELIYASPTEDFRAFVYRLPE